MGKIFATLSVFAVAAMSAHGAQQDVTLYGQLYNGSADYGIYSFSSGTDAVMEKVTDIAAEPNCGSVSTGSRFYCFSAEAGDYGTEYAAYVYDSAADYTLVTRIGSAYSMAKAQQVLACDPTSSKIYTVYQESGYYGGVESYLGIVDISNRTITKIGSSLYFGFGSTAIVAMAFDPEGQLYGIASNSYLYKIDKTNANLSNVGSTGIYPQYEQSMTFSPDGSVIFWAACNDDINALYSVDPSTASAKKIKDFVNGEEFVSLWTGGIVAADGAPAAATDLKADFQGASLSGTITFTAPVLTHAGNELGGVINYEIKANEQKVSEGTTAPGRETVCPVVLSERGVTDFTVTLSNSEGIGESASLAGVFVGPDTPRYVENLRLEAGSAEGEFIVSWDSPETGAHGGYVDPAGIKYRVRRLPDFEILSENATSPFTDSFLSETPVMCSYEVMPYVDENISGLPLTSNSIMTGKPFEVPYSEDFESTSHTGEWTIIDANGDGHSWEYQWDFGYYRVYNNDNPKDDWLISPYVRLESGKRYCLTFDVRTIADEEIEVRAGQSLEPAELDMVLIEPVLIPDTNYEWQTRECTFTAPVDGKYHFGFHAMTATPENALAAYIDNVKVERVQSSGIEAVEITGAAASELRYFNMQGVEVSPETLVPGIYIVSGGDASARKVVVK